MKEYWYSQPKNPLTKDRWVNCWDVEGDSLGNRWKTSSMSAAALSQWKPRHSQYTHYCPWNGPIILILFLRLISTFVLPKSKITMLGSVLGTWSWGCSIKGFPVMTAKIWEESVKRKVVLSGRHHGRIDGSPHVTTQSTIIQQNINPFFLFAFSKLPRVKRKFSRRNEQQFS